MSLTSSPVAALDAVAGEVSYIRVAVGEPTEAPRDWLPGASLVRDPAFLYDTMRATMDGRGIERDDVGMSLIVQGYAFRVASVAIGTWLLTGGCVDVSPENVRIQFGRDRPNSVRLSRAAWVVEPGSADDEASRLAALHDHLVGGHLAPLVDNARASVRIGERLLWSNISSACASSFGAFMRLEQAPDHAHWATVRDAARSFFSTAHPELRRGGSLIPIGPIWAWQRNACCLYYRHSGGDRCDDCSLHSAQERADRRARIMAEVGE